MPVLRRTPDPARPTTRPTRPAHHLGAVALAVVLTAALGAGLGPDLGPGPEPPPAAAVVTPASGFSATVLGWSSWYGAYDLGALGWGWCIDHGSSAPDPDLAYGPTSVAGEIDPSTRAAIAWAVTMNAPHDAVTAAAIMLALHDLRGASYPFGPLQLDHLGPGDLAGFGGLEATVLARARAVRADARGHAHLRAPFAVSVTADRAAPDHPGALRVTVTDAGGQPVPGVLVRVDAAGAALAAEPVAGTGDDGAAWFAFRAGPGLNRFAARVDLPATEPAVYAPTLAPAQRVAVPSWASATGADEYARPPPTTTSTTTTTTTTSTTTTAPPTTTTTRPTTTTTTRPATTTTTRPGTTTTRPTGASTTTTRPAPTSTTTTSAPTTTSTPTGTATTSSSLPPATSSLPPAPPLPGSPAPRLGSPSAGGTLPITGRPLAGPALVGGGLGLCGTALVLATRRYRPRPSAPVGTHGPASAVGASAGTCVPEE